MWVACSPPPAIVLGTTCLVMGDGTGQEGAKSPGPWFNIKISSYRYRKSHCGDNTVVRSSYLHNGISYTGKTISLYWFSPQGPVFIGRLSLHVYRIPIIEIRLSWNCLTCMKENPILIRHHLYIEAGLMWISELLAVVSESARGCF